MLFKDIFKKDFKMQTINSIPVDILKIQKKLCEYEIGSRNYKKYNKILKKHVKNFTMKQRLDSNIKTIERIKEMSNF